MNEAPGKSSRLLFLDVIRLLAAVQMIQGHSVAAVLAPHYRQGLAYSVWSFARGLTSILFLTSAGLAFVLAEQRASPGTRRSRVRRALTLVAIGYLLHAPLALTWGAPIDPTLRAFVAVDVLQCIGVSLLALELLSAKVRTRPRRILIGLGLGLVCFGVAPWSERLELAAAELVLGNYVTSRYGSLFPLLPWTGYVLIGFGLGSWAFRSPRPWRVLGGAALVCGLAGAAALRSWPSLRASSPGYCLVKLGCVLALSSLLAFALRGRRQLPWVLGLLATETLFLYVSHVLILYADGVGLEAQLGPHYGPAFGLALAAFLLLSTSAGALAFRSLRLSMRGSTRAPDHPS